MATTPLKAIREKCLDCCVGQSGEVKMCPAEDCPLWPFRFGKNPYRKREMTEEQKKAAGERMKKAREAKKNVFDEEEFDEEEE